MSEQTKIGELLVRKMVRLYPLTKHEERMNRELKKPLPPGRPHTPVVYIPPWVQAEGGELVVIEVRRATMDDINLWQESQSGS